MDKSEQILVCINSSPSSSRVIHTAARMAEAFQSKWTALYVETEKMQRLSKEDKKTLNANFNLVEQLDGEIVTVHGDNIVEEIIGYANFRNITKIIIGKNNRKKSWIFSYYAKSLADRLMNFDSDLEVYVIPNWSNNKKTNNLINGVNLKFKTSLQEIFKVLIIMAISTIIGGIFDYTGFSATNILIIYILGIIIVYIQTTGYLTGIISSIIAVVLFNYFFTAPRYSLQVYDKSYLATFPIMLIVAITIGTLTNKIQREAYASSAKEKQTQNLYRVSKKLLSAMGTDDVVAIGIKYISRLINRTVICYLEENSTLTTPTTYNSDKKEKESIILCKDEQGVANWTFLNGKESGAGSNIFYGAHGYYMPIKGQKNILGVIGVSCFEGILEPKQKFILETVTSQISVALDREILSKDQEVYKIEIETERLRSDLLRSISHDLRSPLAGIKGSVSTIIEDGELISEDTKKVLLQGVYEDTEWLIRLVENLLSMTRFDQGKMKIKKNVEVVEEVISESIHRSTKNSKEHKINVNMPENFIMATMDGSLIEQVLINLIDNAIKFTPKGSLIEVKVYEENKNVFFEVIDNGTGISEEILPHVFDRFFTNGSKISDSRRGVGLGLTICKSIVEAHGGRIEAFNREGGGAIFKFYIPKE